jgi:long-subunit acyl-CoA synthetase (AMP-forming)
VKGNICVYDEWFATGDLVKKKGSNLYFLSRI